jgi:hypothetical protein
MLSSFILNVSVRPVRKSLKSFCENYGDGEEVVAGDSVVPCSVLPEFLVVVSEKAVGVGLAVRVPASVLCLPRSRKRETAGSNKPIRMAMIAMTTSNSISVKAQTWSRSFDRIDAEEVLFDFIGNRCGGVD